MTTDLPQPDAYDLEVQRLQAVPDEQFRAAIQDAWGDQFVQPNSLFRLVRADVQELREVDPTALLYSPCNCLTEIRAHAKSRGYYAQWPELLPLIAGDARLPDRAAAITREHLPLFARYQRALDRFRETRAQTRELTEDDLAWFKQQVGLE